MAAWRLARLRLIEGGLFQLRAIDDAKNIERDYQNLPARTRLAYLFLRDVRGPTPSPSWAATKPASSALSTAPSRNSSASRPPALRPCSRVRKRFRQTKPIHHGQRA